MPVHKPRLLVLLQSPLAALPGPQHVFASAHFDVLRVTSSAEARRAFEHDAFDLVVSELEFVHELHEVRTAIALIGAPAREADLIQACRNGAAGYVLANASGESMLFSLDRLLAQRNLRIETVQLRQQLLEHSTAGLGTLVGASSAMQHIYQMVHRASSSRAPWLIVGEAGVGKRVVARHIHVHSNRADGALLTFRTTGTSDESAATRLIDCLHHASGGTLLIEHVDRLPASAQLALLDAIEHGDSDVRILTTTTLDLAREVAHGRFGAALFEQLRTLTLTVPPLRERGNDILLLADHFLQQLATLNQRPAQRFSPCARAKLMAHSWPGNVRALERLVERVVVDCDQAVVEAAALGFDADTKLPDQPQIPGWTMAELERHAILQTLDSVDGSTARAAQILDVSVRTIQYRLHEYGMVQKRNHRRRSSRAS